MKKIVNTGLAAIMAAGSMLAAAAPAAAQNHWNGGGYGRGYGYGHRDNDAGAIIAGGIAGLALGAALSGPHYGYYAPGPYYGPAYGYGGCVGRRTVWDPYYGRYVVRSFRYAC